MRFQTILTVMIRRVLERKVIRLYNENPKYFMVCADTYYRELATR